jgi:phosphoribosyl-AMP cyclohydrolase / phosphoribosyl-ATP pyrophosphohydrolase
VQVISVHPDCDRDSLIYLADPDGPSCHTGARTCWFEEYVLDAEADCARSESDIECGAHVPRSTLLALEHTIERRRKQASTATGTPLPP